MSDNNTTIIVLGSLNTDIVGLGVSEILGKGEAICGGKLMIGPGGKSRNIAQMIATLLGENRVAMVGKTSKDPFGLWKPPIDTLNEKGVDTTYVKILAFEETKKYPGIALIPVDKNGNNQIYVLPGISDDFSPEDVDDSRPLFDNAKKNNGTLALTLELPLPTAVHSLKLGAEYGLKCVLDPGGADKTADYSELLSQDIFLIKPNEHEAKILTGIEVTDFASAKKSAQLLLEKGVKNVLITVGKNGAYFFNDKLEEHIQPLNVEISETKDETGCGDQTMATLCAYLSKNVDILEAVKSAIASGTLQFYRQGIQPVNENELKNYLNKS